MLPFRILGTVYTDVFRGLPTLLLIFLFGFGVPPALQLSRPWNSPVLWASVALSDLNYGAYSGGGVPPPAITSVHPSQVGRGSARWGCRKWQGRTGSWWCRSATRRVIPPLINDFVALQKRTALLIAALGPIEALRQAYIDTSKSFNFSPYVAAGLLFLVVHHPAGPPRRLPGAPQRAGPPMRTLGDTIIDLRGVVDKSYGRLQVLHGVDFSARGPRGGERSSGRRGCGKSTLLKCINLLEPVQGGTVRGHGPGAHRPVRGCRRGASGASASCSSRFNLFPHLSVLGNVTLAPRAVCSAVRRPEAEQACHPAAGPLRPGRQG